MVDWGVMDRREAGGADGAVGGDAELDPALLAEVVGAVAVGQKNQTLVGAGEQGVGAWVLALIGPGHNQVAHCEQRAVPRVLAGLQFLPQITRENKHPQPHLPRCPRHQRQLPRLLKRFPARKGNSFEGG